MAKQRHIYEWWHDPDLVSGALHTEYLTTFKKPTTVRSRYHSFILKLDTYRLVSRRLFVSVGCFGIIAAILLGLVTATYSPHTSALAPPANPTITVCGARTPAENERYAGTPSPATPISASEYAVGSISSYVYKALPSPRWYIETGNTITVYDAASKSTLSTFSKNPTYASSFGVDDSGNYYFFTQLSGIYKYTPGGSLVWHVNVGVPLDKSLYTYGNGASFRVASEGRGLNGSVVFDGNGVAQTNNAVIGYPHYNEVTNHLISIDNGYVRLYDATGMTQSFYIGTGMAPNDPGPTHFYVTAGAEDLPDGRLIVLDARGLMFFSSNGDLLGQISQDTFIHGSGALQFVQRNLPIQIYNGKIYYANGAGGAYSAGLSSVPLTTTDNVIGTPDGHPTGMGIGAGPFTNAPNSYFPSGTTPQIYLQFYPWWSQTGTGLTGSYKIRSAAQVKANVDVPAVGYNVTINPNAITNIPVTVGSLDPGYYEMDVKLQRNGQVIGSSCLHYSIGAPGQALLPAGGPGDVANIQYARATGQNLYRGNAFKLDDFIPNGDANSVAPMVFPAAVDSAVQADATAATANNVIYEIQLADGSTLSKALVANGKWGPRIQELINHFKPWIHTWEVWNEPNNTYGGALQFTNNIVKPAYTAIKAADATATVVGGGILNVDLGYWSGIIAAGGLDYMDVAGEHTYTGHNRSFEEQGQIGELQKLRALFTAAGHPNLDIYDTESGFWSNGPASFWSQGDKQVRKQILEASIGMKYLSNFQNSTCYNDGTVVWGDICNGVFTPAMPAMGQYAVYTNDKHFSRMIATGIPHSYAAEFTANDNSGTTVVAVWTEDFDATIVPELGGSVVQVNDQYGKSLAATGYPLLTIGGAVTYLTVPAGKTLTIHPQESYNANVALASSGSTATASSAAAGTPVSNIIDGKLTIEGHGNNFDGGVSIWTQHYTDTNPTVTVSFTQPQAIDRVYVASQGINSVQTGLRSYDVQVDHGDGNFVTVASVHDDFFNRTHTVSFTAQTAAKVRLTNMAANYSGYGDGLPPSFWPDPVTYASDDVWIGQTTIYELEAYAAGTVYAPPVAVTPTPVTPPPVTPSPPAASTAAGNTAGNNSAGINNSASQRVVSTVASNLGLTSDDTATVATTKPPLTASPDATTEKPSVVSKPPTSDQVAAAKPKSIHTNRVKAIISISSMAILSAGLVFFGYEIYRHRRHALSVFPPSGGPLTGIHVG